MGNQSMRNKLLDAIDKQRYDKIADLLDNLPELLDFDLGSAVNVTPLARAVWRNDMQLVEILLKRGANVNNGGSGSITPLMWACKRDNPYLTSFLIENGADMTLKSNEGYTALDYAIVHGNYRPALFIFEFYGQTQEYFDYYQFAKDRDYRYVNYEMFLASLKKKTQYTMIPDIFRRPEKKRYIDPVVDPRESWKDMAVRMIDFKDPPLVERTELPSNLQPQNRVLGKLRQQINGLQVEPIQRPLNDEGENLHSSGNKKHEQSQIQIEG